MGIREGAEAPFLMCLTLSTMYIMLHLLQTASRFRSFHELAASDNHHGTSMGHNV